MNNQQMTWQWQPNTEQQTVFAAVAWGEVGLKLVNHLLQYVDDSIYTKLQIATHSQVMVLMGEQALLPWVDGLQYATYQATEPRLWLPSHMMPAVPIGLLAEALYQHYQQAPLLLWHHPKTVIPLNKPQMVSLSLLKALIKR